MSPTINSNSARSDAGVDPWDSGHEASNAGLEFSEATSEDFVRTANTSTDFIQIVANSISNELGQRNVLENPTDLASTKEAQLADETRTLPSRDGTFSADILPRPHGTPIISRAYLKPPFATSNRSSKANSGSVHSEMDETLLTFMDPSDDLQLVSHNSIKDQSYVRDSKLPITTDYTNEVDSVFATTNNSWQPETQPAQTGVTKKEQVDRLKAKSSSRLIPDVLDEILDKLLGQ